MLYTISINIYDILTTKIQCVCAHAHTQHTLPFAAHGTGTIPNIYTSSLPWAQYSNLIIIDI